MKTNLTLFLVALAAFMAGPAAADGVCPMGAGVCYTKDCAAVAGSCIKAKATDLTQALDGYAGENGTYTVSTTCEDGKDLSNVIALWDTGPIKYEAGIDELPEVPVVDGIAETSFIMKCGNVCYTYGPNTLTCNPRANL